MAGEASAGVIKARLILDTADFRRGMQQARQEMQGMKDHTSKFRQAQEEMTEGLKRFGLGLIAVTGASIATAARFEQAMARVKAISGATGEDFERLKQTAMELGAQTQYSATDAANGMALLAAAGYKTNQIIAAMPGLLNLAAASGLDLATSADYLTSIMAGFHLQAKDSAHAVDVLTKAMNDSNAELTDIAESMKYVGPIAGQLGISLEETAAAIGIMANYGIKGSQAGTSLRMSLERLANPTKAAQKLMAQYGISLKDAQGHLKPFPQILDELHDKLSKVSKEERQHVLNALVGVEALTGFSTLVDQGGRKLAAFSEELKHSDGAAKEFAATMKDTLMGRWEQFTSSLETLGIKLGQQFLPEANAVLEFATNMANALSELNPQLIEFGLKVAAGATSALLLRNALLALPRVFQMIEMAMGPGGWLALGIGALVGAIWSLSDATQESAKVDLAKIESTQKQVQHLEAETKRYEQLRSKLKLTTDEMLRYMDLQKLIQSETNPEYIRKYQEEMGQLQKKSGLTNNELQELIRLNNDLIQKIPTAATEVSKYGNQWLKATDAIRQYNKEQREALRQQLQDAKDKIDANVEGYAQAWAEAARKLKYLEGQADLVRKTRVNAYQQLMALENQYADAERKHDVNRMLALQQQIEMWRGTYDQANKTLNSIVDQKRQQQGIIDAQMKQLRNAQMIYEKMMAIYYADVGITYQWGQGSKQIDAMVNKYQQLLNATKQKAQADGKVTAEEQKQIQQLENQLKQYKDAQAKIKALEADYQRIRQILEQAGIDANTLNKILGKPANKEVNVDPKGKAKAEANKIHKEASKPASKNVTVKDNGTANKLHKEATKPGTKQVKVDDRSTAAKLHQAATKPGTKNVQVVSSNFGSWLSAITAPVRKVVHLIADWIGGGPSGRSHQGGPLHHLPKYHDGGIVDPSPARYFGRLGTSPKFNEVDVRLLRNELVLTAAQQANLFRLIQTFDYATAQRLKQLHEAKTPQGGNIIIQVGSMVVREEADIKKIAEELERMTRIRKRARGEYF